MSGKWDDPNVPKSGWSFDWIEDIGEPDFICEMCEVQDIRYIHHMTHPEFGELLVGCICAGHMEADPARAVVREAEFKNRERRRFNWTRRRWRRSRGGNSFLNVNGFNIVVFPKDDHWSARITNRETGETTFAKRKYLHENAAKLAAFDALELLMARAMRSRMP